jgi:hypothetical protein
MGTMPRAVICFTIDSSVRYTITMLEEQMSWFNTGRARRVAATGIMSAVLIGGAAAGIAHADGGDNSVDLKTPGSSVQMPTWFLGATQLCVKNANPEHSASVEIFSGTSRNNHTWDANDARRWCWTGSFWGFKADVINRSPSGTMLHVYEPIGPSAATGPDS